MFNSIFRIVLSLFCISTACFANDLEYLKKMDFLTSSPNPGMNAKICEYKNLCSITWDSKEMTVAPYGSIVTALTAYPVKIETVGDKKIHYHAADVKINDKTYLFIAMTTFDKDNQFVTQLIGLCDEAAGKFIDIDQAGFQGYLIAKNEEWCKELIKMGAPQ